MSLPSNSIDEILDMASNRHEELPSPRGVANLPIRDDGSPLDKSKIAGSAVDCLEYAEPSPSSTTNTAPSSPPPSIVGVNHFSSRQIAERDISQCATRFLNDVFDKTLIMTSYFSRMTVRSSDVAKALELFVQADACEMWYCSFPTGKVAEDNYGEVDIRNDEDEEMDENWKVGEEEYDSEVEEGEGDDEEIMMENNMIVENDATTIETPLFDASYSPINGDEIQQLSDVQFREQLLLPILKESKHDGVPLAKGVDNMLKCAMYAFLVTKLS